MSQYFIESGRFKLNLDKPCIMGILNITPDSFSDGGKYFSVDTAVSHGIKLIKNGADIIDIGGESSRPFAESVLPEQEMERVIPVIEKLSSQSDIIISIDTTKAEVAKEAINAGASIINDISALEKDPSMAKIAAEMNVPVILMHMKGTPQTMQIDPDYDNLMHEITNYLKQRALYAIKTGIKKDNIILDPGIGFGKTVKHNLLLIKHLKKIISIGFPVLIGPSKKSFIQKTLSAGTSREIKFDSQENKNGTLAAVAVCVMNGAHIIRVHDVKCIKPLIQIITAIQNS